MQSGGDDLEAYLRAYVDAYGDGGFDAVARYWHPDIEYREDPRWPEASTFRGRAAVVAAFKAYEETLGSFSTRLERVVDAGDGRFAIVVASGGTAAASGLPHEHRWGYVGRLRDGLVVDLQAYYDPEAALAAVGARA